MHVLMVNQFEYAIKHSITAKLLKWRKNKAVFPVILRNMAITKHMTVNLSAQGY